MRYRRLPSNPLARGLWIFLVVVLLCALVLCALHIAGRSDSAAPHGIGSAGAFGEILALVLILAVLSSRATRRAGAWMNAITGSAPRFKPAFSAALRVSIWEPPLRR